MIVEILGVSKLKRRLQRLVRVYTCQNTTLLEISCHGLYYIVVHEVLNGFENFKIQILKTQSFYKVPRK